MATKTLLWLGAAGLLVLGGFYFLNVQERPLLAAPGKPWIEVTSEKMFAVLADGSTLRELKTGDEVANGTTLRSDVSGRATIHLPDGSAFRLDVNSTLTLELARLDLKSETLTVRAALLSGRVWSKIVNLATPESTWEVKTSNAVATVRGTAFFTEYKNGKSRIWSSEHEVRVRPVDPATTRVIEAETAVAENALLEITDEAALAVAARPAAAAEFLVAKPGPKEIAEERWVKENRGLDSEIEKKAEIIREEAGDEKRARQELREEVKARKEKARALRDERRTNEEIRAGLEEDLIDFRERVRERILLETSKEGKAETTPGETRTDNILEEAKPVITEPAPTAPASVSTAKPTGLVIQTRVVSRTFTDGDRVAFAAVLVFSDGSRRDLTARVNWKVSGNVGFFESPGVFVAKLREEDSELGEIKGAVEVILEYEGATFTAPPLPFSVMPRIEETELRG